MLAKTSEWLNKSWDQAVKFEVNPDFCRDVVTIASGSNAANTYLKPLTLLGKITASGKFVPLNPAATDGSENVAGVLYSENVDASAADKEAVVLVRGIALVVFEQLVLVNSLTTNQKAAAKAELLAMNIKCVTGV